LEGQVGELKQGMQADLMIIDLSEPAFVPMNSAARQIVYAECGRAIETVLVAGKPVVLNGRMTTVDEAALAAEAVELLPEIKRSAVQASLQNAELMPAVRDAIKRAWNVDIGINRYVGGGRHS
jgi:hypothetical protein